MARTKLGSLLQTVEAEKTERPDTAATTPPAPTAQPASRQAGTGESGTAASPTPPVKNARGNARTNAGANAGANDPKATAQQPPAKPTAPAPAGPRYLELTRKEARLTATQLDELTVLTRQLNKARRGGGERITDNTIIRVAVDLLLHRRDEVAGATEDELRTSLGL